MGCGRRSRPPRRSGAEALKARTGVATANGESRCVFIPWGRYTTGRGDEGPRPRRDDEAVLARAARVPRTGGYSARRATTHTSGSPSRVGHAG